MREVWTFGPGLYKDGGVVLGPAGCELLVYPGAFNMTTGPAHWELLQRARSVTTHT